MEGGAGRNLNYLDLNPRWKWSLSESWNLRFHKLSLGAPECQTEICLAAGLGVQDRCFPVGQDSLHRSQANFRQVIIET